MINKSKLLFISIVSFCMLFFSFLFIIYYDAVIAIPFTLSPDNQLIVNANINGQDGKWILDTGWHGVLCDHDNFDLPVDNTSNILNFLGDSYSVVYRKCNNIQVNRKNILANVLICKAPESICKYFQGKKVNGLIGLNVFNGYFVEVKFSTKQILLHKKRIANQYYSKKITAYYNDGYNMTVVISIDGIDTNFTIDTGCDTLMRLPDSILLHKQRNEKLKVVELLPGAKKIREYSLVFIHNADVFDQELHNQYYDTNIYSIQNGLAGGYGYLGIELLKNYDLVFDLRKRNHSCNVYYHRILNEKEMKYKLPYPEVLTVGLLACYPTEKGMQVVKVIKDSPCYVNGVIPGVIIQKINNKELNQLTVNDFHEVQSITINGKYGDEVKKF